MTALLRRLPVTPWRAPDDRVVLVAIGVAAVAAGVAGAVLGTTGLLVVGGLVGLCVGLVALVRPPVALVLVLLATFTRNAQKEFLPAEAVRPALVLMGLSVALAVVLRTVARPRFGVVEALMLAFVGWNLLSAVLPHQYPAEVPVNGEPFELGRWFLGAVILPFAVYQGARLVRLDDRALHWLLGTIAAMTAYSTWVSIAQFAAPALVWPRYIVETPGWPGRANGIFNQPVVNGVVLVVGLVVCLFLAERPRTPLALRIGLYALTAAAAYAVYLTHTRAAVLGLVAAIVLGAALARGWRRGFVTLGVLGVAGLVSQASTLLNPDRSEGGFGSPNEIYDRLNAAATALHAIADHPLFGIGVGRFGMYNTYEHQVWSDSVDFSRGQMIIAHENDLGIGAELGLPGLALWLAIVVALAVLLWKARRLPGDGVGSGALATVGLIALAVMMVTGFTVDLRPLEFATTLPLLVVGVVVGRLERHRDAPEPEHHAAAAEPDRGDDPAGRVRDPAGDVPAPAGHVPGPLVAAPAAAVPAGSEDDTMALPAHPRTNGHGAVSVR